MAEEETSSLSSFIIFAVGPFKAWPPTIGETATTGTLVFTRKEFISGIASMGQMLRKGYEGQIITSSRSLLRKQFCNIGAAFALSAP